MSPASLVLLLSHSALAADGGLRVLVQPWSPLTDDDVPRRVLDDPNAVAQVLREGWSERSVGIHDGLVGLLGAGELTLALPTGSFGALTTGSPPETRLTVVLDGSRFVTESCTLDFDLTVNVPLAVGGARPFARGTATGALARISDLRVATPGQCDALAAGLAADLNIDALDQPVGAYVDAALTDLADRIAALGPEGMALVGAWGGGDEPLTVAFGVRGSIPDDGRRSALFGTLRSASADGPLSRTLSCDDVVVHAGRKSGPRPILDAEGHLGDAPLEPIDAQLSCGAPDENGLVQFAISGVSATFPTVVALGSAAACDPADPAGKAAMVRVHGIDGNVLPGDLWQPHALVGGAYLEPCGSAPIPGGEASGAAVSEAPPEEPRL